MVEVCIGLFGEVVSVEVGVEVIGWVHGLVEDRLAIYRHGRDLDGYLVGGHVGGYLEHHN